MTQLRLPEAVAEGLDSTRKPLTERVASYFRERPNCWVNARELMNVGGFAAWRTRVSELRQPPYSMVIDNRTRRINGFTVSEYRFVREEP